MKSHEQTPTRDEHTNNDNDFSSGRKVIKIILKLFVLFCITYVFIAKRKCICIKLI